MSDTVIMIVMGNENKVRFSEPENRLSKGASKLMRMNDNEMSVRCGNEAW